MKVFNIKSIANRNIDSYHDDNIALLSHFSDLHNIPRDSILVEGFFCACIIRGKANMVVDNQTFELFPGDIFACSPRNILEHSMLSMDIEARIIFLSTDYLEKVANIVKLDWTFRIMAQSHEILHGTENDVERFVQFYNLLQTLLNGDRDKYQEYSILGLFASMAYSMFSMHERQGKTIPPSIKYSSAENIVQRFIKDLCNPNTPYLNVNGYAEKFNVTPKYFSTVCKKQTGKTAGDIINEEIIRMAEILLRDNTHNIKNIATLLGFANQSHFGSFFRRHKGVSPQHYRSAISNTQS